MMKYSLIKKRNNKIIFYGRRTVSVLHCPRVATRGLLYHVCEGL